MCSISHMCPRDLNIFPLTKSVLHPAFACFGSLKILGPNFPPLVRTGNERDSYICKNPIQCCGNQTEPICNACDDVCAENTVRLICLKQKNLLMVIIYSWPINYTRMPFKHKHTHTKYSGLSKCISIPLNYH